MKQTKYMSQFLKLMPRITRQEGGFAIQGYEGSFHQVAAQQFFGRM